VPYEIIDPLICFWNSYSPTDIRRDLGDEARFFDEFVTAFPNVIHPIDKDGNQINVLNQFICSHGDRKQDITTLMKHGANPEVKIMRDKDLFTVYSWTGHEPKRGNLDNYSTNIAIVRKIWIMLLFARGLRPLSKSPLALVTFPELLRELNSFF
jgi:hypothetical protein